MSVAAWGWTFLVLYFALMIYLGYLGMRRTTDLDQFATARGGYTGLLLGLSFMATTASGSTFMGIPGLAYAMGFKAGYYPMLYPIGIYLGSMVLARRLKRIGDRLGSLTIPDFLGDFYHSRFLRAFAAIVSIFLIYYIMGQLAAAGHMFDVILGVPYHYGVWLAMGIVMIYMVMGGSHSDIITDAVQGLFMLAITSFIVVAFLVALGIPGGGGPAAVNAALPPEHRWDVHTDPENPLFFSWWTIVLLLIAHLGFCSLPHLGNKFFAMRGTGQAKSFAIMSNVSGVLVGFLFLGGVLGRAIGIEGIQPDAVIPTLFTQLLPGWAVGLLSIAVLSAIISTADGLFMSVSQIFANDLYRKTYVPMMGKDPNSPEVDRTALIIGRIGVAVVGIVAAIAVYSPPALLSVLLWVGIGGIIATLTGPLFLAAYWRRVTTFGAVASALCAFAIYFAIHLGPQFRLYPGAFPWNNNPFASTAVAMIAGTLLCVLFSLVSRPLPEDFLNWVHGGETAEEHQGAVQRRPMTGTAVASPPSAGD